MSEVRRIPASAIGKAPDDADKLASLLPERHGLKAPVLRVSASGPGSVFVPSKYDPAPKTGIEGIGVSGGDAT